MQTSKSQHAPERLTSEKCVRLSRKWSIYARLPELSPMERLDANQQVLLYIQAAALVDKLYNVHNDRVIAATTGYLKRNTYAQLLFDIPPKTADQFNPASAKLIEA